MSTTRRIVIATIFSLLCLTSTSGLAKAKAASASISRSYQSNGSLTPGSLISLDPSHSGYVVLANTTNQQHLIGVAVSQSQSLLAINPSSDGTQVALSGIVNALVSNANGNISIGDQIAVSAISGVGQLSEPGGWVIGVAQNNFSPHTSGAKAEQITATGGKLSTIYIGYVPIDITIGASQSTTPVIGTLQRIASDLTGHSVSITQVILSALITLISLAALITLIYGTIRGSLLSIGRNPLAKPAIFESLAQVLAMSVLIVVIAVIIDFLILR